MKNRIGILLFLSLMIVPAVLGAQEITSVTGTPKPTVIDHAYVSNQIAVAIELNSYKKSPFAASAFSLLYAGAGQFYLGDYTKGSLFFLGETLYHLFNYGIRIRLQTVYGETASFNTLNTTDQVLIISSFFIYIGIKAFSMYDAYVTADTLNQQIDEKLQSLMVKVDPQEFSISYRIGF
ncbi:MAG: hypothetical protein A2Y33_16185 [Spirochaetes bacterium GWF1_51_8]|nr:MAG: hypothetical protein A2Y33_16185 [Spirochaetes bacterium GWF1_51_8]